MGRDTDSNESGTALGVEAAGLARDGQEHVFPGQAQPVSPRTRADLERLAEAHEPFEAWSKLNREIGLAATPAVRDVAVEVRDALIERTVAAWNDEIRGATARGESEAAEVVGRLVVSSIESSHLEALCRVDRGGVTGRPRAWLEGAELVLQQRWEEAYGALDELADQTFVPPSARAGLLVLLAELDTSRFGAAEQGLARMQRAQELAPDAPVVDEGWGDYWSEQRAHGKARRAYAGAIERDDQLVGAYVGLAQGYEAEGRHDDGLAWYEQLVARCPGSGRALLHLAQALAQQSQRQRLSQDAQDAQEARIAELTQRARVLLPTRDFGVETTLTSMRRDQGRLKEAEACVERAAALRPDWPSVDLWRAQLAEANGDIEKALDALQALIERVPSYLDAHWSLTALYQKLELWDDALQAYRNMPKQPPPLGELTALWCAEILRRAGKLDEAQGEALALVRRRPRRASLHSMVERIAQDRERNEGMPAAQALLDELRGLAGESYEGRYQQQVGQLWYALARRESDDASLLQNAVDAYRLACQAEPHNSEFRADLAATLRHLKEYGSAEAELRRMLAGDGDEAAYGRQMATLCNEQGHRAFERGDFVEASRLYREAARYDPKKGYLHRNLVRAILDDPRDMDAVAEARRALERATELDGGDDDDPVAHAKIRLAELFGVQSVRLRSVEPIVVEVGRDLAELVRADERSLNEETVKGLAKLREHFEERFGIPVPKITLREHSGAPMGFAVAIDETPVRAQATPEPTLESLLDCVKQALRGRVAELVHYDGIVAMAARAAGRRVDELEPRTVVTCAQVSRHLLAEQVPLSRFDAIWAAVDRDPSRDPCPVTLAEGLRAGALRDQLPGNETEYVHARLAPELEALLARCAVPTGTGAAVWALPKKLARELVAVVERAAAVPYRFALVVDQPELRPLLRMAIARQLPDTPVLAKRELLEELAFEELPALRLAQAYPDAEPSPVGAIDEGESFPVPDTVASIRLRLGDAYFDAEGIPAGDPPLSELLDAVREGAFAEMGVLIPRITPVKAGGRDRLADRALEPQQFVFDVRGFAPDAMNGIDVQQRATFDNREQLEAAEVEGQADPSGLTNLSVVSVETANLLAEKRGRRDSDGSFLGPQRYLQHCVAEVLRRHTAVLLSDEVVDLMLERLRERYPHLVQAVDWHLGRVLVAAVLRRLAVEGVTIQDLRGVLESMLSLRGSVPFDSSRILVLPPALGVRVGGTLRPRSELTEADYVEYARWVLRRQIVGRLAAGGDLSVLVLPADFQQALGAESEDGTQQPSSARVQEVVESVRAWVRRAGTRAVILTSPQLRVRVARLLRRVSAVRVISYAELPPEVGLRVERLR